ncbi:type II toxin-antitoxin system RelE/ParE family toxin [Mesorhizobium sp. YIM 152430]|uniref:type II toxin-antitoxin system RelE/ParE family toxin n=1 Tax=Mesorhizobium sp. YIM 152430 TaxID=3031761 RepID=UPI0023DBA81B|nr:type II toxin-antitoxin system RelE/ParE family toxin [Mesorhizobium sp. YIM 152430]MDF1598175.1 type II toxin-antitoxin system RelE/ParE family toxin [Mesorhizobium sp. YIM 152430]
MDPARACTPRCHAGLYRRAKSGGGVKLVNGILDRTGHLSQTPEIGRNGRVQGTRELVLPDIGYVVAYRLRDDVEILAVMHGAREWPEDFD